MNIIVSPEIAAVCPEFVGACVEAQVVNTPYCEPLWQEIEQRVRDNAEYIQELLRKYAQSDGGTYYVYKMSK